MTRFVFATCPFDLATLMTPLISRLRSSRCYMATLVDLDVMTECFEFHFTYGPRLTSIKQCNLANRLESVQWRTAPLGTST